MEVLRIHALDDEFEPLLIPCDCVNTFEFGLEAANHQIGAFHHLWNIYRAMPAAERPNWRSYIQAWETRVIEFASSHSAYRKPDPNCEDCSGAGLLTTRRYPRQLFDCWTMGSWENLGPVMELEERPDFAWKRSLGIEALITPYGRVHEKSGFARCFPPRQWFEHIVDVINDHRYCIGVKCLMGI